MRALTAVLVSAALVAGLAGCGEDEPVVTGASSTTTEVVDDDQVQLDAARRRWREAGVDDYELEWSVLCFCPRIAFVDTIDDGAVVDHRPAADDDGVDDPGAKTMEDIFDEVQDAIDSEPASLDVEYDADTGAVRSYFVDVEANMADEEHGLEVAVRTTTE